LPAVDVATSKGDKVLSSAFGTPTLRERTALELVFTPNQKTWDTVAIKLGVTPKRASEMTSVAMQKLRRATHTGMSG
jgi:DNA-directed RNA polymerase sigma subunit (sigma70/sigma32)